MTNLKSDIEIARAAKKKNIKDIADLLNIPEEHQHPYGHHVCKINLVKKLTTTVCLYVLLFLLNF